MTLGPWHPIFLYLPKSFWTAAFFGWWGEYVSIISLAGSMQNFFTARPHLSWKSGKITVLRGDFSLYRKNSFWDPIFKNLRGLGTQFFRIETFGIWICSFLPELPGKWALSINFFCIDPAVGFQIDIRKAYSANPWILMVLQKSQQDISASLVFSYGFRYNRKE